MDEDENLTINRTYGTHQTRLIGEHDEHLERAVAYCLVGIYGKKQQPKYVLEKDDQIHFFAYNQPKQAKKLSAFESRHLMEYIRDWLREGEPNHAPGDCDGSTCQGWLLHNEGEFWAIFSVARTWVYYHK